MIETLLFTAGVTLPVCMMMVAGILLKRTGFIDDHFIDVSSRLVFNFGLPAVLFFSLSSIDPDTPFDSRLLLLTCIASVAGFVLAWFFSLRVVFVRRDRGVFIQGAARGNLAIVGLALAGNLYGEAGIAQMSLYMAATVPIFNIMSIIILAYYSQGKNQSISPVSILQDFVTNPLMIAVLLGVIAGFSGMDIPDVVDKVGNYFAQITLPLALLGVGGSLSLQALKETSIASFWASLIKVFILPAVVLPVGMFLGYKGMDLGILLLMFACPTAAASFVMTKAVGGNSDLATNIVVLSTLGALPAISLGLFVLRTVGVV